MADAHVTIENIEGDEKRRWHTAETYKVPESVAKEFDEQKTKLKGYDLQSWVKDHGGVLDDDGDKAARVSTKNDGTILNDHYKNGEYQRADVVKPKGAHAKADDHAGAHLLLALMTGGTSLFVTPFVDDKMNADGSKFTSTTPAPAAAQPAAVEAKQNKVTVTTTATAKPKP